jgi:hypothetical protein
MTAIVLGLLVMLGIVVVVSSFAVVWIGVERRQAEESARKATPWYREDQGVFTFSFPKRDAETMAGERR